MARSTAGRGKRDRSLARRPAARVAGFGAVRLFCIAVAKRAPIPRPITLLLVVLWISLVAAVVDTRVPGEAVAWLLARGRRSSERRGRDASAGSYRRRRELGVRGCRFARRRGTRGRCHRSRFRRSSKREENRARAPAPACSRTRRSRRRRRPGRGRCADSFRTSSVGRVMYAADAVAGSRFTSVTNCGARVQSPPGHATERPNA